MLALQEGREPNVSAISPVKQVHKISEHRAQAKAQAQARLKKKKEKQMHKVRQEEAAVMLQQRQAQRQAVVASVQAKGGFDFDVDWSNVQSPKNAKANESQLSSQTTSTPSLQTWNKVDIDDGNWFDVDSIDKPAGPSNENSSTNNTKNDKDEWLDWDEIPESQSGAQLVTNKKH